VDAAVLDAGDGDHHDAVTKFTEPRTRRRVFAGKGASGTTQGFAWSRRQSNSRTPRLAIIGVDVLKATISTDWHAAIPSASART
jgi:Phage terminase large subunit (GpA)